MDREVGIRQLKNEASALIDEVERGATVTVTRRGRAVARVVPASMPADIASLIADGRIEWNGRKPAVPAAVALHGEGSTAADQVIADRGPR